MLTLRPMIRGRVSRPPSRPGTTHETASIASSIRPSYAESLYVDTDQNAGTLYFTRPPQLCSGNSGDWNVPEQSLFLGLQPNAYFQDEEKIKRLYVEPARQSMLGNMPKIPCYTIARIEKIHVDGDLPRLPDSPIAFAEPCRTSEGDWETDTGTVDVARWSTTGQTWADERGEREALMDDTWSHSEVVTHCSWWKKMCRVWKKHFRLLGSQTRRQNRKVGYYDGHGAQ